MNAAEMKIAELAKEASRQWETGPLREFFAVLDRNRKTVQRMIDNGTISGFAAQTIWSENYCV